MKLKIVIDKLGLSRAELSQAEAKIGSFWFKLSQNTTNFKLELLRLLPLNFDHFCDLSTDNL